MRCKDYHNDKKLSCQLLASRSSRVNLYSHTPLSGTSFGELIFTKVPLNGGFFGQTTKRFRYSIIFSSLPKLDLRGLCELESFDNVFSVKDK